MNKTVCLKESKRLGNTLKYRPSAHHSRVRDHNEEEKWKWGYKLQWNEEKLSREPHIKYSNKRFSDYLNLYAFLSHDSSYQEPYFNVRSSKSKTRQRSLGFVQPCFSIPLNHPSVLLLFLLHMRHELAEWADRALGTRPAQKYHLWVIGQ